MHQHLRNFYSIQVNRLKFLVKRLSLSQSPLSQCLCHFHNNHNKGKIHGKLDDSREVSGKNLSYKSTNPSEHLSSWSLSVLLTGSDNPLYIYFCIFCLFVFL